MFNTSEDDDFSSTVVDARARSIDVSVLGTTLTISQQLEPDDLAPLFSDAWTGSCLWNCSVVLSEFIGDKLKKDASGKRFVELGAGCGLCSLYLSKIGAKQVVATDQATMISLIRRNATANDVSEKKFEARELMWGKDADISRLLKETGLDRNGIDIILISDCLNPIYGEDSYEKLARTIVALCSASRDAVAFLAYEHRDGGGEASKSLLAHFFDFVRETMRVEMVHRVEDIDIFRMENKDAVPKKTRPSSKENEE